jgi:hypothetical protein
MSNKDLDAVSALFAGIGPGECRRYTVGDIRRNLITARFPFLNDEGWDRVWGQYAHGTIVALVKQAAYHLQLELQSEGDKGDTMAFEVFNEKAIGE